MLADDDAAEPSTGDFGGTLIYNIGNLAAGVSKSFTAEYIRP